MTLADLAPATRARRLVAIRQFYEYLRRVGRLEVNPAQPIAPPRLTKRTPKWLTPEEVRALRHAIPGDDRGVRDRAIVELGLQSLRISEVLGLDLDDLYLDRRQVRITGKGGDEYLQPITDVAISWLELWLRRRPNCASQAIFVPIPPRGTRPRLTARAVEGLLRGHLTRAGIRRPLTFHSLRHTVGVMLADQGVPLQFIQDLLRHRSPATTRVYTQVARERLAEVLDHALKFPE